MPRDFDLIFPGHRRVHFTCPEEFHLGRWFADRALADYEPLSQAVFLAAAEQGRGAVFDVGANIGVYAVTCATALRRSVYAFEPFAEAAAVLRTVAAGHGLPIHVREAAVGASEGEATLFVSSKSDMSNSLNPDFRRHAGERPVPLVSIDGMAAAVAPCAIKIDTESTEMAVLAGARETLLRDRPAVLLEVLTDALARDVGRALAAADYHWLELGAAAVHERLGGVDDLDLSGDRRNWLAAPRAFLFDERFFSRARSWLDALRRLGRD